MSALMSAFGGKADIETWVSKSAFDPKRTLALYQNDCLKRYDALSLALEVT